MTAVLSPCIRNCCLNQENICLGCFRSLPEITGWQQATDQQRLLIRKAAEKRGLEHRQKYPDFD